MLGWALGAEGDEGFHEDDGCTRCRVPSLSVTPAVLRLLIAGNE